MCTRVEGGRREDEEQKRTSDRRPAAEGETVGLRQQQTGFLDSQLVLGDWVVDDRSVEFGQARSSLATERNESPGGVCARRARLASDIEPSP